MIGHDHGHGHGHDHGYDHANTHDFDHSYFHETNFLLVEVPAVNFELSRVIVIYAHFVAVVAGVLIAAATAAVMAAAVLAAAAAAAAAAVLAAAAAAAVAVAVVSNLKLVVSLYAFPYILTESAIVQLSQDVSLIEILQYIKHI